ncbi:MAG TPA: hypothetical protein VFU47_00720 [Armatimonadota bacterium]|nr:hypothetical protein [Armatimonadota bacterium]
MYAADQPLLLLICDEPDCLQRLRSTLREAGYLAAASRSLPAAISLLSQVRVDGCVLWGDPALEELEPLRSRLDTLKPGCLKLIIRPGAAEVPEPWKRCSEPDLLESLAGAFGLRPGRDVGA